MRYFIKELVTNPIYTKGGSRVPWEEIGDDMGLLCTEHPVLLTTLEEYIRKHQGGVREISVDEIGEYKKKASAAQSSKDSAVQIPREPIRLDNYRGPSPRKVPAPAGAAADSPRLTTDPKLPAPPNPEAMKPLPRRKSAIQATLPSLKTEPTPPAGQVPVTSGEASVPSV